MLPLEPERARAAPAPPGRHRGGKLRAQPGSARGPGSAGAAQLLLQHGREELLSSCRAGGEITNHRKSRGRSALQVLRGLCLLLGFPLAQTPFGSWAAYLGLHFCCNGKRDRVGTIPSQGQQKGRRFFFPVIGM